MYTGLIMYKRLGLAAIVLGTALIVGGCASSLQGDSYSREDARTPQIVRMGTIQYLRPVKIEGTKTPIGAASGAAVGGIAGSSVGGGKGSYVAAVIGAVAGGLIGAATEEGLTRTQGVEITVQEDNGPLRAYVQAVSEGEVFKVGERVRITSVNGQTRVAH
jgi:outer membrane lipoprotein SlyB